MEDHIRQRAESPTRKARELGRIEAMMITHERPGLLAATVRSFQSRTMDASLTIFDDGSESKEKRSELDKVELSGVRVIRLPKAGFITTWMSAFEWARQTMKDVGGVVLLEDDLSFAFGWLDVLRKMYEGTVDLGWVPGAMSCLRVHEVPQAKVVNLRGIEAYQSMGHSFQVNLMPWEIILAKNMIEGAEKDARRGYHGLDVYLLGAISHQLGRINFMSVRSWVAHEGVDASVVEGQGYRSFRHRGYGLVNELRRKNDGVESFA